MHMHTSCRQLAHRRAGASRAAHPVAARALNTRKAGLAGPSVITLKQDFTQLVDVPTSDPNGIAAYTANATHHLQRYQLPMGAQLTPVDPANGVFLMKMPRLQFVDIAIRPVSKIQVDARPGQIVMTTISAELEQSDAVTKFGLQDRYAVDVTATFTQTGPRQLKAAASMKLDIDLPHPFSMLPKDMVQATGNSVMAGAINALMTAFIMKIKRDIQHMPATKPTTIRAASSAATSQ